MAQIQDLMLMMAADRDHQKKQYLVYDVDNDVTDIYIAQDTTANLGECLQQHLVYDASKNVIKIRWKVAVWDSAWDYAWP